MRRVPLQISVAARNDGGDADVYAICNDGTVWQLVSGQWVELPGIPQNESHDPLAKLHSRHVDLLDAHAAARTQLHQLADLAGTFAGCVGTGPRREALREAGGKMMDIIDR